MRKNRAERNDLVASLLPISLEHLVYEQCVVRGRLEFVSAYVLVAGPVDCRLDHLGRRSRYVLELAVFYDVRLPISAQHCSDVIVFRLGLAGMGLYICARSDLLFPTAYPA